MANLDQMTRRQSDRSKLGTIRKWLNMAGSLSKAICGSFLQLFLTRVKFMVSSGRAFVKEQIKQKLVAFEGDAKASKTRSIGDEVVVEMHIYGDCQNG